MPVYHVFTSPQADVADPTIVRPSNWNSSHLATMVDIVSLAGNTAGVLADMSGTLVFAGGNNITLSQNGNTVTISAGAGAGTAFSAGVSSGGNTSGDTGTVNARVVFVGGNNVTLSQATAVGGSATITISGASIPAQSLQTQSRFNLTLDGNTSGALALISSGVMVLAGGNNVTLSQAGNAVTISGASIPAQTVQTQNLHNLTLSGNTSGALAQVSSGTLTLAGGNNITLSQAGNAITISAFTQTVQTQNRFNLTLAGNTAGVLADVSSGTLVLAGGNNVTLSQAGNSVTISGGAQSAQPGIQSISGGTTRVTTGEIVFSNSNGVGFGINGQTLTASYTQSTHSHSDAFNILSAGTQIAGTQATVIFSNSNGLAFGMSNSSIITGSYSQSTHGHTDQFNIISAGTQIAGTANTIIFSDSNGVAFGMSNNSIVTASYSQSTHAHSDLSAGMSTQGNTSGTTGLVAAQLIMVGGNNVTLSQSVNGQSATLTISAGAGGAAPTLSHWANYGGPLGSLNAASGAVPVDTNQNFLWIFPLDQELFPGNMSALTVQMIVSGQSSSNWTVDQTFRYSLGIYTRANASQLSLLYSASSSYTDGATSQSSLLIGHRWLTFGSADFNAAPNFSQTEYYGALWLRSSGQSRGISILGGRVAMNSNVMSGTFGAASNSGNSLGPQPWHGYYSASFSSGMPSALHRTDIVLNATANQLALVTPFVVFNNYAGLYG